MLTQMHNLIKIILAAITDEKLPLESVDWEKLYKLAESQSVIPLLYEGAVKYSEFENAPVSIKEKLSMRSMALILLQAQRTEEFLKLYDALLDAGIKPLVIKGLICRITYGEYADHRPSGDEDIYILKDDFKNCKKVLIEHGCIMEDMGIDDNILDVIQEITFSTPSKLLIEVHMNLFDTTMEYLRKCNDCFKNSFETKTCKKVAGTEGFHTIYTLEPTLHYLFLFLHLYKHFVNSGVGIRQVLDLAMFEREYKNEIDFKFVEKKIAEFRAMGLYTDVCAIGNMMTTTAYKSVCLLMEMIDSGIFGNENLERIRSRDMVKAAVNGENFRKGIWWSIFPSVSALTDGYPFLNSKPWLLPAVWIHRWCKFLSGGKMLKRGNESLKIADKRLELMRKYDMVD